MSLHEILSLVLLVAVFALSIWRGANAGLVALGGTFVLAAVAGLPADAVFGGFPVAIVLLIVSVMYMFGHVQRSGAIDRMVHVVTWLSGGRDWLLPWGMFLLGALLSGVGTLPSATVAVILPISMRLARSRDIDPVVMGVIACSGAGIGGFSALSPWAVIIHSVAVDQGMDYSPITFFLWLTLVKSVITLVAFFALGGVRLMRRPLRVPSDSEGLPAVRGAAPMSRYELGSLIGIGVFLVAVLFLRIDIVVVALIIGLVLHLVFRPDNGRVVAELPWGVILLLSGIMMFVGALEHVGTLETLSQQLGGVHNVILAILAISYLAAFFATIESSTIAVLTIVIPLTVAAIPDQSPLQFTMLLVAVCGTISTVAISPINLGGGLVLANVEEKDTSRVFRWTLAWSLGGAVVLPLVLLPLPVLAHL